MIALGNSYQKERSTITDPFAARTQEVRKKKGKKVLGEIAKTRSQKVSEDKGATLEVEIQQIPANDKDTEESGTEGTGRCDCE